MFFTKKCALKKEEEKKMQKVNPRKLCEIVNFNSLKLTKKILEIYQKKKKNTTTFSQDFYFLL